MGYLFLGLVVFIGLMVVGGYGWLGQAVPKQPNAAYVGQETRQLSQVKWEVEEIRPIYLGINEWGGKTILWGLYRDNAGKIRLAKLGLGTDEIAFAPVSDTQKQVIYPESTADYHSVLQRFSQVRATILAQGSQNPPYESEVCQKQERVCQLGELVGDGRILTDFKDSGRLDSNQKLYLLGVGAL